MSLEQTARAAELDLDVVRFEASDLAKQAIEGGQPLRPFAITLSGESNLLQHEVSEDAGEGSATAVEILAYGVRAGITPTPRAVALVRGVTVRNLLNDGETFAICIALEHASGLSKRYFLPYRGAPGRIEWDDPREVSGIPWFFASAEAKL